MDWDHRTKRFHSRLRWIILGQTVSAALMMLETSQALPGGRVPVDLVGQEASDVLSLLEASGQLAMRRTVGCASTQSASSKHTVYTVGVLQRQSLAQR
ncbi:hypothetical protein F5B21DRAFT_7300 [Xylaria acuta]|nr:hypothetical protein F5B21DRAFT_7300 [Xylaria acuta]